MPLNSIKVSCKIKNNCRRYSPLHYILLGDFYVSFSTFDNKRHCCDSHPNNVLNASANMSHVGESIQKSTVIYRCCDDINNFKIRVNIKEVREGLEHNDEMDAGKVESETKIFLWQQKVYGKFEREIYKDPKNCVTNLAKKYYEDVANLIQNNDVLFTYVNEDEFCQTEESCVLNSKTTTELYRQINSTRLDQDRAEFFSEDSDEFDFKQSLISSLDNPYGACTNFDVMHIIADLGEYVGETWLKSEYVLCTIKYDHVHKLLLIYPDFTNIEPYYIQIDDSKRIYQYYLQDASEKIPIDVLLKENEILNKILSRQTKLRLQKTGTDFELPPKNKLSVHLFVEILTAEKFEYKDIYVQYFIDLPENWFCKDPASLKGTTQTSHSCGDDNLSYFGFPFEVCLEYNIQEFGKSSGIFKGPYIYFEVISKDSWDRFRTEGLTYTILPISQPGVYRYDLHCLRICPKGPSGNLRRFFIGDCSSYNDITWISVPNDHDKKVVNKHGTDTIGTGQISIRINVIHQSQAFMADFIGGTSRKHEKFILEKLNLSTLVKSIEQVLEAFKVAKRKMIEARKNVSIS